MNDVIPQAVALRLQLAAIAGNEPAGGLLEVRYRLRDRPGMGQLFHAAERPESIIDSVLRLGARTDVYAGAAPRRRRHGGADAIERVWTLWADLDGQEAVDALAAFTPAPSIIIRTGSGPNCHAWWALHGRHPLTPEQARRANQRLAHHLGGDMRSTDPARILRLPGTLNHKHDPPAPVECIRLELDVHAPRDIVGVLVDPPASVARKASIAARDLPADDALKSIPSADYIPALTGRDVTRAGFVTCPFHAGGDERTPSLHASETGGEWFCHGCSEGGSIIDFAARLYRLEPRGRGYFDIRRRLAGDLLGRLSA